MGQDGGRHVDIGRYNVLDFYFKTVACEVLAEISSWYFILTARLFGNGDDVDLFSFFQKWQSVGNGTRSCAAPIPANHDAIQRHPPFLDERHENDRPTGFEQHGFVDDIVWAVSFRLTENNKIKASANTAELVGGACNARAQNAGFVRKSFAFGCLFEPADSRVRLVFRFEIRRDTAQCVSWNDGFIGNGGAEHMRFERHCDRNGINASGGARSQSKVDDDILHHAAILLIPDVFGIGLSTCPGLDQGQM